MPEQDAGLSPPEWAEVSQQRARLYGWFSTLYAAEVPEDRLSAYLTGDAIPIAVFNALGLDTEIRRFKAALASLRHVEAPHLELAADFAQIFLLDANTGALPYASVHDGEGTRLYGPAEARMRSTLTKASLAIQEDFREPADHLAVYLAVMARLAETQAEARDIPKAARDQITFLQDGLLTWLPSFHAANQKAKPRFDVYPALSALLIATVEVDAHFIRDIAESGMPVGGS